MSPVSTNPRARYRRLLVRAGLVTVDDPDERLLKSAADDPQAFGRFYDRHAATVSTWFLRRTACPEAAGDLTAETFAEAFRTVHRYRPARGAPRAWLFGIARNQWRRYVRTGAISDRALARLGVSVEVGDHADAVAALVDLHELAATVQARVDRLNEPIAAAVRLRVLEGLPYEQVASQLGCSVGAARVRVTRGLAELHGDDELADQYRSAFPRVGWVT